MGIGSRTQSQPNQVYYDSSKGQYYTVDNPYTHLGYYNPNYKGITYLGNPMQQNQQVSPINDLLAKAASAKANVPTLASLFPSMGQGMLNAPVNTTGQWGAGRFLSPNASQFGNPAQPMGGFAPNVTNTTT